MRENSLLKVDETAYKESFCIKYDAGTNKAEKALSYAIEMRKFEIENYWKRAAYFWALIAAAFAGYFAVLGTKTANCGNNFFALILGCVGFIFTWAWFLVNRGSKYWQENWENHVDMLEDTVIGPLFKTIVSRPKESTCIEKLVTAPLAKSPSKINNWVSLFTLFIWAILIFNAFTEASKANDRPTHWYYIVIIVTLLVALFAFVQGNSDLDTFLHCAQKRDSKIINC